MAQRIVISAKGVRLKGTLDDSAAAATVAENLPIEGLAQTRGAEVFFFVDFAVQAENLTEEAPSGSIAYWPAGSAVCIFYGGHPVTPVELVGRVEGDTSALRKVISGDEITMEKA